MGEVALEADAVETEGEVGSGFFQQTIYAWLIFLYQGEVVIAEEVGVEAGDLESMYHPP